MRGAHSPDWFYLLSGSDYPTLAPERVISFLGSTDTDVFIDHREIQYRKQAQSQTDQTLTGFRRPSYNSLAYKRYCAVAVPRPSLAKPLSFPPVGRVYLRHPMWRSVFLAPFGPDFRCFAGEHWFTANAKAAEVLLTETAQSRRLFQHLHARECPEECYYQTILANAPLKLENDNLRFIEWPSLDAWHPKTLAISDLPAIEKSQAHFARKVDYDSDLTHELDRMLGVGQPALR
jgi:hypothetical protein